MGMDVYAEAGVIASTEDLCGLIRRKDLKAIKKLAALLAEDDVFADWERGRNQLQTIAAADTVDAVTEQLAAMVVVHGEPSKYGSDECYLEGEYELLFLWQQILSTTRPNLPPLDSVQMFDSGRLNGWDVPHGVACFIFSPNDCFVSQLTEQGAALKKAIGHCEKTEWTRMSY